VADTEFPQRAPRGRHDVVRGEAFGLVNDKNAVKH
jgi:hypothetical protein